MHNLWTVFTSPRKIVYIFGGSMLTQLMYALILGCCLQAYGGSLPLAEMLFVNTFVSLFGGLIPVPGGIGVYEAGLTAGLTAIGVRPPSRPRRCSPTGSSPRTSRRCSATSRSAG